MFATSDVRTFVRIYLGLGGSPPHEINPVCDLEWDDNGDVVKQGYAWTGKRATLKSPGVYVMFDAEDEIVLYVGQTKNLGARLDSWFLWQKGRQRIHSWGYVPAKVLTVTLIDGRTSRFLEEALIEKYHPKYNDRLRLNDQELQRQEMEYPEGDCWRDGELQNETE